MMKIKMEQEQLTFANKTEFEANIITDFLSQEGIKYTTEVVDCFGNLYNIHAYTDLNHFLFIKKLADEKLEPYLKATKSYMLSPISMPISMPMPMPMSIAITMSKDTPIKVLDEVHKQLEGKYQDVTVNIEEEDKKPKVKKSMLLKIVEWLRGI